MREYGAGIAEVVPQSQMDVYNIGESRTKHGSYFPTDDIYSRVAEERFDEFPFRYVQSEDYPIIWEPAGRDREWLNDLWRHEYRHQGMDILRERQDRSPWNKWIDNLRLNYTAPVDYELAKIFKPGFNNYLQKSFGIGNKPFRANEEALMRVMDVQYGKSQDEPIQASLYLHQMADQGLINKPSAWLKHFADLREDDPNNYLNTFATALDEYP